ncbi:MAG: [protein-PII] uridylyltransferase [Chthoniobacterales bacterium]|nr:[protein-PII] uridylyltransferase [Chthoniobacterales bacterium]
MKTALKNKSYSVSVLEEELSLEKIKKFYQYQEKELHQLHLNGESGRKVAQCQSELIDNLFKNIVIFFVGKKKKLPQGLSVVAIGGYGRGEMNPYSDIDIMFLYEEINLLPETEQLISSILMTLWDFDFKVGHSTRSLEEVFIYANQEMVFKTAILECRFLAGDKKIYQTFKKYFRKKCLLHQEETYIAWRFENIKTVREKNGKSVFMQEPHIKFGSGGLRDYQNLLWISIFHQEKPHFQYLIKKNFLTENERKTLEKNYDFLLRVRNEMHYQEKRGQDQLTLHLQGRIAQRFGFNQQNMIRRSEAFMKQYYEKTRDLYLITSAVLDRLQSLIEKKQRSDSLLKDQKAEVRISAFVIKGGSLFPQKKKIFSNPVYMMQSFQIAQKESLQFSPELKDLFKKNLFTINHQFQKSLEIGNIFLTILSRKGEVGRILRMMHDLGFLGKYLPEFGELTCLVQHEFYHLYTADEHTLVCLEKIDSLLFLTNKKFIRYSNLFKNFEDPAMLYLAMLLHDTGKAANVSNHANASAEAAKKVAARLQLSEKRSELLYTLVKFHGELATVARTRDLEDETTITHFAHTIKKESTLDALIILTLADGMGASDTQWSDWKEQLVWNLYDQTKRYLALGETFFEKNRRDRHATKTLVREMLTKDFNEEIDVHFEQMPERYFKMMEPSLITDHLQLFRSFFEKSKDDTSQKKQFLAPEILWKENLESGYTEVSICGWDREQLLERYAAAFLAAGINILSADIFTRQDHVTLDIFRVTSVRPDPMLTEKEKKIMEKRLQDLLKLESHQLQDRFKKDLVNANTMEVSGQNNTMMDSRLLIDNHSHPSYTIVEVETADREGLFYDLVGAVHFQDITIDCARIATEMRAAFDTFYILGSHGKKLDDKKTLAGLHERLLRAVQK